MEKTKHTPGTWYGDLTSNSHIIRTSAHIAKTKGEPGKVQKTETTTGLTVCYLPLTARLGKEQVDANARLIIAAPTMLQELKAIGHQTQITTEHFNRLQRLIAQIEGE